MRKGDDAFVLAVVTVGLAVATDNTEHAAVISTVNQFVDGFNRADSKMALAACAHQTSIIDDFPPNAGQNCSTWLTTRIPTPRRMG